MNAAEIKTMSTVERLQTMEAIWDSLLFEDTKIKSPEWHNEVLAERRVKVGQGEAEFVSIKDLKVSQR